MKIRFAAPVICAAVALSVAGCQSSDAPTVASAPVTHSASPGTTISDGPVLVPAKAEAQEIYSAIPHGPAVVTLTVTGIGTPTCVGGPAAQVSSNGALVGVTMTWRTGSNAAALSGLKIPHAQDFSVLAGGGVTETGDQLASADAYGCLSPGASMPPFGATIVKPDTTYQGTVVLDTRRLAEGSTVSYQIGTTSYVYAIPA